MKWVSRPDLGDPLELVWTREDMGLSSHEFSSNVETVKDLDQVWKALGGKWGSERSVLLDDEEEKVVSSF